MKSLNSDGKSNRKSRGVVKPKLEYMVNRAGTHIRALAMPLPFGDQLIWKPLFDPMKANPDFDGLQVWPSLIQLKVNRQGIPKTDDILKLILDEGMAKFIRITLRAIAIDKSASLRASSMADVTAPDFEYAVLLRYVNPGCLEQEIEDDFYKIHDILSSAQLALNKAFPEIYSIRQKEYKLK